MRRIAFLLIVMMAISSSVCAGPKPVALLDEGFRKVSRNLGRSPAVDQFKGATKRKMMKSFVSRVSNSSPVSMTDVFGQISNAVRKSPGSRGVGRGVVKSKAADKEDEQQKHDNAGSNASSPVAPPNNPTATTTTAIPE